MRCDVRCEWFLGLSQPSGRPLKKLCTCHICCYNEFFYQSSIISLKIVYLFKGRLPFSLAAASLFIGCIICREASIHNKHSNKNKKLSPCERESSAFLLIISLLSITRTPMPIIYLAYIMMLHSRISFTPSFE